MALHYDASDVSLKGLSNQENDFSDFLNKPYSHDSIINLRWSMSGQWPLKLIASASKCWHEIYTIGGLVHRRYTGQVTPGIRTMRVVE